MPYEALRGLIRPLRALKGSQVPFKALKGLIRPLRATIRKGLIRLLRAL